MPTATVPDTAPGGSTVDLCYDVTGPDDGEPMLLVMGFTAQMTRWPPELVQALADQGFRVIRFDNRDCGLSSKSSTTPPDIPSLYARYVTGRSIEPQEVPYTLSHMAADGVGLLDHLGIDRAHVVGASMGGMIVQMLGIEHRERVASITSIMSTTGNQAVGGPSSEAMGALLAAPPVGREAIIEQYVAGSRIISGPLFDEARARANAEHDFDRSFHPLGAAFQLAAIAATGDRTERLGSIDRPTLVVHGLVDPLIDVSGGRATADAIPGADLMILAAMGHDLPVPLIPQIAGAITGVAHRDPVGV